MQNVNLISIKNIEGNSGAGNPLFSKQGKIANTFHSAFNEKMPRPEELPPEEPKTFHEIKEHFVELKCQKKFETALLKFEKK